MTGLRRQLRDNLVALTSLAIALAALAYNTWRNKRTERNRNIRVAGIELLQEIGSLQQIIFYAHYASGDQRGSQGGLGAGCRRPRGRRGGIPAH